AAGTDTAAVAPRPTTITGLTSTVATITLPVPIPAGGTATIEAEWNFEVPNANARGLRMGRWGDTLYQVAQWYPQLAVYDDLRGWDTDLYLGDTEFYNNYGHYDVTINVPAGWIVGATGYLRNPADVLTPTARERLSHVLESDSQRTIVGADERGPGKATVAGTRLSWHFVADTVGDFAWGTSNQYVFDATRANIPGKGYIPYYLMYLPGHANFHNQGATGRHALEFYSKLWFPYAWNLETQVDGPEGGMEYPMFIMAAGSTDHETGHQWWPMMVGTNETWYGFMDEGFNQYMNALSGADRAGGRGGAGGGGRGGACPSRAMNPPGGVGILNCNGQSFGQQSGDETYAPLMWDANYGGPRYQDQAYGRAPKMLSMLGGIVGDSAVWHAMSEYAKAWRFKHPSPWDYAFAMSRELHQDLGWFWYYWLFTTDAVDGSIASVATVGAKTTVTVRQDGQMPSPVVLAVTFAAKGPAIRQMANSRMIDSVTALVTYPVDVWFPGSKTFKADLSFGGRKIEKITLDPYGRFPDHDLMDNVWPRAAVDSAATRNFTGRAGRGGR
ncbi:MAG: M1 family peptidase, partial [Gemmatimonadota bacterium]